MKYLSETFVTPAIYDTTETSNPLIEALPDYLSFQEFCKRIETKPPLPAFSPQATKEERIQQLSHIQALCTPLDYMYYVYNNLYRMMQSTYQTRTSKESILRLNALVLGQNAPEIYAVTPKSGSLLGTPGIGKTTTLKKCLALVPQVIQHSQYHQQTFQCKQILWLFCECPPDASIKTLALNLMKAIDNAVGSNHFQNFTNRRATLSTLSTYIKTLCLAYHVGVIVVDEIQNVINHSRTTRQTRPLIRFLTELTNDSGTAIYLSGTLEAEKVFQSEEYLKRRTRGLRLLPFKPDCSYYHFIQNIWEYQYTKQNATYSNTLAKELYHYSRGIPAYIIKIFEDAQVNAIFKGDAYITSQHLATAVQTSAISLPVIQEQGTSISDLCFTSFAECEENIEEAISHNVSSSITPHNPAGRKRTTRDAQDLLAAFHANSLSEILHTYHLIEEI